MQLFLLASCLFHLADAELVFVQALMRHGTRAPNPEVTEECPTVFHSQEQIIADFAAPAGHLTAEGLHTCFDAGKMLRKVYLDQMHFMPDAYGPSALQWKFMSQDQYRHLMSINSLARGLFPNEPVPIFSHVGATDRCLKGPPEQCLPMVNKYLIDWFHKDGPKYQKLDANTVDQVGTICGLPHLREDNVIYGTHPALQDIDDMFSFMAAQKLPLPAGLTPALQGSLKKLVWSMMQERVFHSNHKVCGAFIADYVKELIESMESIAAGDPKAVKFEVACVSREKLYAVAELFGLEYICPGFPAGSLAPSSTLMWELHREDAVGSRPSFEVKLFWWYPSGEREPLTMHRCNNGGTCPLSTFKSIMTQWNIMNGDWTENCKGPAAKGPTASKYSPASAVTAHSKGPVVSKSLTSTAEGDFKKRDTELAVHAFFLIAGIMIGFLLHMWWSRKAKAATDAATDL